MLILVSGTTRTVARLASCWPNHLGHMLTPNNRNSVASILATGLPWCADNGAFKGFDPERFRRFLDKISRRPRCLWVAAPDVVADASATVKRFDQWLPELVAAGQPVAFVGQDGAEDLDLPWDDFDAWFIGGSTRWKLSQASSDLVQEAKRRRKVVHMGRVNSRRRLRAAMDMGCDSVDGSSLSMYGDKYIHTFCRWAWALAGQPVLPGCG